MSDAKLKPISVVIFERRTAGGSDVPVFAGALKAKVNDKQTVVTTPSQGVNGGPRSGQTLGFPSTPRVSGKVIPEDPALVRHFHDSSDLLAYLHGQELKYIAPPPEIRVGNTPLVLAASHRSGLIDQTVYVPRPQTLHSKVSEGLIFGLRRSKRRITKTTKLLAGQTDKLAGWLIQGKLGLLAGINQGLAALALLIGAIRLPRFTLPVIHVAGIKLPKLKPTLRLNRTKTKLTKLRFQSRLNIWPQLKLKRLHLVWPKLHISRPSMVFKLSLPAVHLPEIKPVKLKLRVSFKLPSWKLKRPHLQLPRISLAKPKVPNLAGKFRAFLAGRSKMWFVGQSLTVVSIVLALMTVGPIIRLQGEEWWNSLAVQLTGKAQEPAIKTTFTDVIRPPEVIPPAEKQFQLLIPKLDLNTKVIANVDAGDEAAYTAALKQGVAHAAGSGLPGETNAPNRTIYIFGHSTNGPWNITKYNALFYSLKDMVPGDQITVWFWGKQYDYVVNETVKIDPNDVSYLQPQTAKDQLILQTCWPPGTTWKRLLVIATPKTT